MKWGMAGLAVLAASAVFAPFLLIPLVFTGLSVLWWTGLDRWWAWQSRPHFATGPEAALIGRHAIFVPSADGAAWAELDGKVWPVRLPPFEPRPPPGAAGIVINVADGMLVVRPVAARASAE